MSKTISKGLTVLVGGTKYIVKEIISVDGKAVAYCETPTGIRATVPLDNAEVI